MSWSGYGQPQGYNPYNTSSTAHPTGQHRPPPPGQYGAPPPGQYGAPIQGQYGPPPPGQYGPPPPGQYGPPPPGQYGAPPPGQYGAQGYGQQSFGGGYHGSHMAPPAGPPPGVDPVVWGWFQSVDADRSGRISATELQRALHNSNWSCFNAETCRLIIGMFDKSGDGQIDVQEFSALWKYVQEWKNCFDSFDRDRSGTISQDELSHALNTFGYRLSPQFAVLCIRVFDRTSRCSMKFDDFIQCCVMLKTLTDKFRVKDNNMQGVISISYEQFLEMVLDTTLAKV